MKKITLALVCVLSCCAFAAAQTVRTDVLLKINSENGIYQKGDTVRVWADVKAVPQAQLNFKVFRWCDWNAESETPVELKEGENLLFERVFNESVQYVFEVTDNQNPKDFKKGTGNSFAGIVVAPEEFKPGFTVPEDFDAFWNAEIKAMRKQKIKETVTNKTEENGLTTYHVDIPCVGPAPVRAYVSYPYEAQKGSLPIIICLHAAGQPGSPSKAGIARQYAKMPEGGALAMDINAHGMLDDQPAEFYKELAKGELKGYSGREPLNREDYYFKWMMLRAIRALDYLCKNPLWDGKHVIVTGTSQGGYQSAFLAGIDPRVTAAVMTVPAGIDQGSPLQGRPASWPYTMKKYPESSCKNIPYFDPAGFLCRTKADIWCEIGLYDFSCPAANLFAVLNTVSSEKTIITFQRPHSLFKGQDHKAIDKQREQFIKAAAAK